MESICLLLYLAGTATLVVAAVWSFVVMFRENAVLAILCQFLPFGLPVALVLRWPRTWRPLGLWVLGFTIFFCGLAMRSPGE
jgi:hypothetical protein